MEVAVILELLKVALAVLLGISHASQAGSPAVESPTEGSQASYLHGERTREEVMSHINQCVKSGDSVGFLDTYELHHPFRPCPDKEVINTAFEEGHWDTILQVLKKCKKRRVSQATIDREFLRPESKLRRGPQSRIASGHCPSNKALRQALWSGDFGGVRHYNRYCNPGWSFREEGPNE